MKVFKSAIDKPLQYEGEEQSNLDVGISPTMREIKLMLGEMARKRRFRESSLLSKS